MCCDFDYRVHETAQNRHKSYCMNGLIRGKILKNNPNINGKNCLDGEAISIGQDKDLIGNVEPISNNEQKLKDCLENHPTKHKKKRKKKKVTLQPSNEMIVVGTSSFDKVSSISGSIGTMSTQTKRNVIPTFFFDPGVQFFFHLDIMSSWTLVGCFCFWVYICFF